MKFNEISFKLPHSKRYHKQEDIGGYWIPKFAIVGASDTGMGCGSKCPTHLVKAEFKIIRMEVLKPLGIKSTTDYSYTSNVYLIKRWLVVPGHSFVKAAEAITTYINEHSGKFRYLHEADLHELIVKEKRAA